MVDKLNTVDSSIVEDEDEDMEKAHVEWLYAFRLKSDGDIKMRESADN